MADDFDTARLCPTCQRDNLLSSIEDATGNEKKQGHQAVRIRCVNGCWDVRTPLQSVTGFQAAADAIMDRIQAPPRVTGAIVDTAIEGTPPDDDAPVLADPDEPDGPVL